MQGRLQEAGYSTHLLGKWHLGHCDQRYTPTHRGFNTFLGSYSGAVDHWTRYGGTKLRRGYDLRNGTAVSEAGAGLVSSELFARQAEQIITSADSSRPFFLLVSLTMVHAPFQNVTVPGSPPQAVSHQLRMEVISNIYVDFENVQPI